jgi:23S rRNA (cytidine2498-2'-O)-methyltransferase
MSANVQSPFLFTTCQVGAEPALKAELAAQGLRLAFSRPGFVTFKGDQPFGADLELHSVFARTYGLSLGKARAVNPAPEVLRFAREWVDASPSSRGKLRLHVSERDLHVHGEEPMGFERGKKARAALEALRAEHTFSGLFAASAVAQAEDFVFDLVVVEDLEWWYGVHRHSPLHSPYPGARPEITVPADSPSRAYLKLEEAIAHFGIPFEKADTAVELGSSPGGAAYALLRRGLNYVGVDPAEMSPVLSKFGPNQYHHLRASSAGLAREDLPTQVQWLLMDMNISPQKALGNASRLAKRMSESLLGVVFTLKLNDWAMAREIPEMLEIVREMGMARVRATQLGSSGREICVYGLTRLAAQRLGR